MQQDRIVVEKFADYWNKANVHIDRITYVPITDSTVRLANLKSGQLDLIERALATDLKDIRATRGLKLATAFELGYQGITINVGKVRQPRVRWARMPAFARPSRPRLTAKLFRRWCSTASSSRQPVGQSGQRLLPEERAVPKRDVAKAKKLLADAGVKIPVPVDFMVPNNPETRQVAEVVQAMAAEAGFEVKIRVTEFATSLKEAEAGNYQAYMLAWSGRTDPDGNIQSFATTGAPNNYSAYSNKDVDAALDEARTKNAMADRMAAYKRAAEQMAKDIPILYSTTVW